MIVDVGANFGEFAIEIAKRNPNQLVIAIEPIPDLCMKINTKIYTENISNIKVLQYAIDTIERIDYLNVAAHHDWGVSSLLEFDESKIKEDEYWKTRSDMYFDTKIEVQVKSLESIFDELSIHEKIDFIKIDTQGLDLNVLKSAGKYIDSIQAGMIEVSISTKLGLYQNENYDLQNILNWLEDAHFEGYALKPNDPASNEFNLYFCRKGIHPKFIEEGLSLKNLPLYDGKWYWHFPSSKLESVEERLIYLEKINYDNKKEIESLKSINIEQKMITDELLEKVNNSEILIKKLKNKFLFRLESNLKKIIGVKND